MCFDTSVVLFTTNICDGHRYLLKSALLVSYKVLVFLAKHLKKYLLTLGALYVSSVF